MRKYVLVTPPEEIFLRTLKPKETIKSKVFEKLEHIPGEGLLVYYKDYKYPKKGVVSPEILRPGVEGVKRSIIALVKVVFGTPLRYFLSIPLFIVPLREKIFQSLLKEFSDFCRLMLEHNYLKADYWCKISLEVIRVGSKIFIESVNEIEKKRIYSHLVLAVAMILEFDDAYRYRFQDIIGELNKEDFFKNPKEEIKRLFQVFQERELALRIITNVKLFKKLLSFLDTELLFRVVKEIDLSKIKLDTADKYYAYGCLSYDFDGLKLEERLKKRKEL